MSPERPGPEPIHPEGVPAPEPPKPSRTEEPYIVVKDKSVSYLGVEVPKGEGGRLVPSNAEFREEYFYLEGHHELMREVATALLLNKPILLEGGTGVYNKTTTIARMCRDLNLNYCKVNFDRETAREDVLGGQTLKVDAQGREYLEWYDGDLMYAIRHGGVAFLDEYNRQSKLAGIVNPILDAILNGRKEISNPYNENERVRVHPNFRLVAAQNPPGFEEGHEYVDRSQLPAETFGRWIYRKLPISYTEEQENTLMAGMIGEPVTLNLPPSAFRSTAEGLPVQELAQIPGMVHWRREIVSILRQLEAKSQGAKREMAKSQRQNLYFNPRLKKTLLDHIARYYTGDINASVQNAFESCVIGMYGSQTDQDKIREMLNTAAWVPPQAESQRRGLERTRATPVEPIPPEGPPASAKKSRLEARLGRIPKEQLETAREILKTDFLGPDKISEVWGIEIDKGKIPLIPFSKEELKVAEKLGQFLILRPKLASDGNPLTMLKMHDLLSPTMEAAGRGKVLFSTSDDSKVKSTHTPVRSDTQAFEWALVSKEVIPDSTSKDYLAQTQHLAEYLKTQVYQGRTPPTEVAEALSHLTQEVKSGEIAKLVKSDWKTAAEKLSNLKINQLFRQTPAQTLYDIVTYYQANNRRLLESMYAWTNGRTADGNLAYVGTFGAEGAGVYGWSPGYSDDDLGVVFSRRS